MHIANFFDEDDGLQPRMEWMLLLSLVFHLVAFFTMATFSSHSSRKPPSFPVYTVNLVTLPREKPEVVKAKGREIKKTAIVQKKSKKKKVKVATKVIKKKKIKVAKKIIKKKAKPKIIAKKKEEDSSDSWQKVTSAIEGIKKKITARQGSQQKAGSNQRQSAARGVFGKTIPYEKMSLKLKIYHTTIGEKIKESWILPSMISADQDLETIVAIKIQRDGKILSINFEEKSRNSHFNESVLRAIKRADPLPPVPPEYQGNSLELGIRFHIRDILNSVDI